MSDFTTKLPEVKFNKNGYEIRTDILAMAKDMIQSEYGINLNVSEFKSNGKKWSDRLRDVFETNGKIWNSKIESDIKYKVAKIAVTLKTDSLSLHKTNSIDALIRTLESILQA